MSCEYVAPDVVEQLLQVRHITESVRGTAKQSARCCLRWCRASYALLCRSQLSLRFLADPNNVGHVAPVLHPSHGAELVELVKHATHKRQCVYDGLHLGL